MLGVAAVFFLVVGYASDQYSAEQPSDGIRVAAESKLAALPELSPAQPVGQPADNLQLRWHQVIHACPSADASALTVAKLSSGYTMASSIVSSAEPSVMAPSS